MSTRVGLDVDGILANFFDIYEAAIRRITGRDLFPPRPSFEGPPVWDWPQYYGYTKEEISGVWRYIKETPSFWYDARPFPDSWYLYREIWRRDYPIYFVSDRPGPLAKAATETWLYKKLLIPRPTVLISVSGKKGLLAEGLGLTHFVEDKLENALDIARAGTRCYLIDRPYNRPAGGALFMPPENLIRVADYDELFRRLFREGEIDVS